MGRFLLRRVLGGVVAIVVTSFVVFAALYVAPGDPVSFLTRGRPADPELIAQVRSQYHLDDPFLVRYTQWAGDAVRGDFGTSLQFHQDVSALVASRLGTTIWLVVLASALILTVGVGFGLLAALRPGRLDDALMVGATFCSAVPSFVLALVLVSLFAVNHNWFPAVGSGEGEGLIGRLHHLLLPSIALAFAAVAYVARVARTAFRSELDREHVDTATARGLSRRDVVMRHVVRNGAGPVLAVSGLTIAGLIVGTAIIEKAFALNGLGSLLIDAVSVNDFPIVQAVALLMVVAFIVVNMAVDILQYILDPRIRRKHGAR